MSQGSHAGSFHGPTRIALTTYVNDPRLLSLLHCTKFSCSSRLRAGNRDQFVCRRNDDGVSVQGAAPGVGTSMHSLCPHPGHVYVCSSCSGPRTGCCPRLVRRITAPHRMHFAFCRTPCFGAIRVVCICDNMSIQKPPESPFSITLAPGKLRGLGKPPACTTTRHSKYTAHQPTADGVLRSVVQVPC